MSDIDHYLTEDLIERARRVLVDEGADSEGGWHSWRCFDGERYPEPCGCTAEIARASLSAVLPDVIRQAKAEALRKAAEEFWARLPDGTGNGRAYNSHRVADMLRDRADEIERGDS